MPTHTSPAAAVRSRATISRSENVSFCIRNVVTVTYRNAATGDRESVTVQDTDSIATYGPRAMQIEEGDASLIDTPEEAQRLANAALADLKDMTATTQLQMPLLPTLDVFSGIVVTDPRVSSTDDFFGVESVRHILDFEARQFRTEVVAGGRVVGGHHRWLRMQTRPGANAPPSPERVVGGGRVLPKPTGLVARGILRGVALDVPVPPVNVNRWAATEVHLSATPGFTPSASTLVASGRETHFEIMSGLAAGTTYYLRAFYVDVKGNKSLASDEVSAVAGRVGTDDIQDNAITDDSTVSETETSPITTTSTSYVEVPDMTLTVNLAVSARVLVLFQSNVNNDTDGRSVDTRLQIDGINYNESRFTSSTGNTTGNNMNMALVDLNAGSHTFKVFWRVSAGTGTMRTRQHFLMIFKK